MTNLSTHKPVKHVRISRYVLSILQQDPFELPRLIRIGIATLYWRYVRRCIGEGTIVGLRCEFVNTANIEIGRKCLLQDAVYIRAGTQGKVRIADRAAINSFCRIFGHGGVDIGEDVQIGPGTLITTTDHDVRHNLEASFKPVKIGRRAWIGANVTILPGITIGDYAVVGAGSVVTKDIPPQTIAVGVPARVIKDLVLDEGEGLNRVPESKAAPPFESGNAGGANGAGSPP